MISVVIKAPLPLPSSFDRPSLFLSGSIEMGDAPDWQDELSSRINGFVVLNPRRDDWDSSWVQSIENVQFREQVEWELSAMERADLIITNFCAGLKAPITLLELGLFAHRGRQGRLAVHCPEGFWRKGNVEIVCKWHRIPLLENIDQMVEWIHRHG